MQTAFNASNGSVGGEATRKRRFRVFPTIGVICFIAIAIFASGSRRFEGTLRLDEKADKDLVQAARAAEAGKGFLETLDEKQRSKAQFEFDSAKKSGWSNLPIGMVPRNGVRMGDLNPKQREAAFGLLAAVLSKEGYQKVIDIMDADQQLVSGKGGGKGGAREVARGAVKVVARANPTSARITISSLFLARLQPAKPWFVQFGGHHLGVNVTLIGKSFVLRPRIPAASPLLQSGRQDGSAAGRRTR